MGKSLYKSAWVWTVCSEQSRPPGAAPTAAVSGLRQPLPRPPTTRHLATGLEPLAYHTFGNGRNTRAACQIIALFFSGIPGALRLVHQPHLNRGQDALSALKRGQRGPDDRREERFPKHRAPDVLCHLSPGHRCAGTRQRDSCNPLFPGLTSSEQGPAPHLFTHAQAPVSSPLPLCTALQPRWPLTAPSSLQGSQPGTISSHPHMPPTTVPAAPWPP